MGNVYKQRSSESLDSAVFENNRDDNLSYNPDWSLIADMRNKTPSFTYDESGEIEELKCTPASLRGHIGKRHLMTALLAYYGIPRYDVEVAFYREISLDWVVEKAYENLERDDLDIEQEIKADARVVMGIVKNFGATDYRTRIVKTLMFIEKLGLAAVDWVRIERSFSGASEVELDIDNDSNDGQFLK